MPRPGAPDIPVDHAAPSSDLPQRVEQHRDVDKQLPEQAPTPLRFAKEQTDKVVQAKREQEAKLEEAANEEAREAKKAERAQAKLDREQAREPYEV
jgi:hypothetical protein